MSWIQSVRIEELEQKGRMVVRNGARQIALFKWNGTLYALDNRCPHEGYPLSEGSIQAQDCILTCNWHNWKFNLNTGDNLFGDDNVTVYKTRIDSGSVWIEIPEIPREVLAERILKALHTAFLDRQYDRIARELARLHFNGIDPLLGLRKAIEWSHDKFEFGMTHAYAVTADWLTLYNELSDSEERLICLLESIDYLAEDSLRQPPFPYTDKRIPFEHSAFIEAVEQENEETATAMILGALDNRLHFIDLEPALTEAALLHYNDFGHSLIYVTKVETLIRLLGPDVEPYLLPCLVRSICYATREDLLRDFRNFAAHLKNESDMDTRSTPALSPDELYGKGTDFAMEWTATQLRSHPPEAVFQALLQAGAKSLLHYDMDYQFSAANPVSQNIDWLDFTHGLTFANAVRKQSLKFPHLWKYGLLQVACFIGRNRSFLDPSVVEANWFVADPPGFLRDVQAWLLDHGQRTPIIAAHYVKTFLAVRQELETAGADCAKYLLAAFHRFWKSPFKEKHVRRTMRQAMSLVGKDFTL